MKCSVTLDSIWWDRPPNAIVSYNQTEIFSGTISELKVIEFDTDTQHDSSGQLCIAFTNKTVDQTVVDEDNNILKDQRLIIHKIVIDEINLDYLLFEQGIYYPKYPDHLTTQGLPVSLTKILDLGFNGKWILKFTLPFHIWYLENLP